jgi:hypothetical protein
MGSPYVTKRAITGNKTGKCLGKLSISRDYSQALTGILVFASALNQINFNVQ